MQTPTVYRIAEKMVVRIAILRTADGATSWDREIASAEFIVIFHKLLNAYISYSDIIYRYICDK